MNAVAILCPACGGRRYIEGLLCEQCNGNGRVPVIFRDAREIARRNLAIAVLVLSGILGAIALLT